jgi:hypothetical protein
LLWRNQQSETVGQAAYTSTVPAAANAPGVLNPVSGAELGLLFGMAPLLARFRIGGRQGFLVRGDELKRFSVGPLYSELTGGFRFGPLEANAFVGVSWLTLGGGPQGFLLGVTSPRVGLAIGARFSAVEVHAFAASEYALILAGGSSERSQMVGLQFSLLRQGR